MSEYRVPIGSTLVNLTDFVEEGSQGETNLGNALTDSMVVAFDETTIAFINDGGIRCSMVKGLESARSFNCQWSILQGTDLCWEDHRGGCVQRPPL